MEEIDIEKSRVQIIRTINMEHTGPVIYWMDRDMRFTYNHAFDRALEIAKQKNRVCEVWFNYDPDFLGGSGRQQWFKKGILTDLVKQAEDKNICFKIFVSSDAITEMISLFKKLHVCHVVTDFSPLKTQRAWKESVCQGGNYGFEIVDTHNIIPVWVTSIKQEFAARTIRPKIHKYMNIVKKYDKKNHKELLSFQKQFFSKDLLVKTQNIINTIVIGDLKGGVLELFPKNNINEPYTLLKKLIGHNNYDTTRNNANEQGVSGLSPYLHYGVIAAQEIFELVAGEMIGTSKDSFLEELIVRRELSDNFCYYNKNYDSLKGAAPWALQTLDDHRTDIREYIYTKKEFEEAKTHDELWNACQNEMIQTGKMHGYMRMYWAKKILEWTQTPEQALKVAIYLNDTYEFDGRDPNGYVGCLWSIAGLHDRPWFTRPIFGLVRYMARSGVEKKSDVKQYIIRWVRNNDNSRTLY